MPDAKLSDATDASLPRTPGTTSPDGVDDHQRRQFAAREHDVADGDLLVREPFPHALVDAFVAAALAG